MTVTISYLQSLAAQAQGSRYVILIGDSLLACATGFLGGKPIVNLAIGGETVTQAVANQLPQIASLVGAACAGVVVMIGTNDLTALMDGSETWDQFTTSLSAMMNGLLAGGVPANRILACSPPPTMSQVDYSKGMNAEYALTCGPLGIEVCNMVQLFTDGNMTTPNPVYYYTDGVHNSTEAWLSIYNGPYVAGTVAGW